MNQKSLFNLNEFLVQKTSFQRSLKIHYKFSTEGAMETALLIIHKALWFMRNVYQSGRVVLSPEKSLADIKINNFPEWVRKWGWIPSTGSRWRRWEEAWRRSRRDPGAGTHSHTLPRVHLPLVVSNLLMTLNCEAFFASFSKFFFKGLGSKIFLSPKPKAKLTSAFKAGLLRSKTNTKCEDWQGVIQIIRTLFGPPLPTPRYIFFVFDH